MAKIEKKPFHEAVVDFIDQTECLATLRDIVLLLSMTEVPKNQKAIAGALRRKFGELSARDDNLLEAVIVSLLKEAAEREEPERATSGGN